jgi:hypothetical protein
MGCTKSTNVKVDNTHSWVSGTLEDVISGFARTWKIQKTHQGFCCLLGEKMNPAAAAEVKQKPTWGLGSSGLLGTI